MRKFLCPGLWFQVISHDQFCAYWSFPLSYLVTFMVPGHFCSPLVTCGPLVIPNQTFMSVIYNNLWSDGHSISLVATGHLCSVHTAIPCHSWSLVIRGHLLSCDHITLFSVVIRGHQWSPVGIPDSLGSLARSFPQVRRICEIFYHSW